MSRAAHAESDEIVDLFGLLILLWRKRLTIVLVAVVFALVGTVVAFLLPPIYRAEATIQIRDEGGGANALRSLTSQLGPLSALAGAALGEDGDERSVALATLKSRAIIQSYIEKKNLLPVLYASRWDKEEGRWKRNDPFYVPTLQDAYKKFTKKVFSVAEDRKTNLVTVAVEWRNPEMAAEWVEGLLADANAALKMRTIKESEANLKYLETQAKKTSIVQLQMALYTLMEAEYKKLMIARNTEDYIFRIIDPPQVPKKKTRPKRALIILAALALGVVAGVGYVLLDNAVRNRRLRNDAL